MNNMPKKEGTGIHDDIKGKRTSHLSSPLGNDTEFHIRTSELSLKPVVGKKYYLEMLVECTSEGDDSGTEMARFVQMGKIDVESVEKETLEHKVSKAADKIRPKESK